MFTKLKVENFKSWRTTGDLRLAPLTGFFGTNSSGKTSLLQSLLIFKQTAESSDRVRVLHTGDDRTHIDLGTYYDLVHSHRTDEPVSFSLDWTLPRKITIANPEEAGKTLFEFAALSFGVSVRSEADRPVVEKFQYRFAEHEFGMQRRNGDGKGEYELIHGSYVPKRKHGRVWPLPPPVKCYGFPDEATLYYQNTGFLPDLVLEFERLFSGTHYLGPLRDYPKRTYVWAGERPSDVGRRGELAIPALLASRTAGPTISRGRGRTRQTVEERIAEWLKEMRLIDSFTLKPITKNRKDYEVRVKMTENSAEVLITDVGFGVSQILPVLTLCYYVPEGSTLILEQPEIHLHPFVQCALADVMIDVVRTRKVQIIVESHSEHFLRRLQRRIAEEEISNKEVALYFCSMEQGESKVGNLDVDVFGNITNWPRDFFGDEMGELAAMTEAAARRQTPT